ncbi:MAG: YidC/Oxa1 family rane protein insertase [Clostridia bacterium]|nr:YidC/Oxa1 family rane protein insertase [Clostridia bacterium]
MNIFVEFMSQSIQQLYKFTAMLGLPNYGLAIILFTIIVKVVLYPLTFKQLRSMRKMQEIQPKIKEIQKKYKGNSQKTQQAIMELYQKENINPLGGCLPLLVQMPILYYLFSTLRTFFNPSINPAVQMDHANFFWVPNLGQPDPYILPVLVATLTFFQQQVSMAGTNQEQNQKIMLYIMPLIIGWMSRNFPAGLALYWVTFSLMGILEQFIIRRQPQTVKEEISAK